MVRSIFDPNVAKGNQRKRREEDSIKSRLTRAEKSKILSLAQSSVKKEDITALCAYGSRIAAFAGEDSDYCIIIVAKNYKENAEVGHEQEESNLSLSSPLIVDETALMKDARQPPSLGESAI